MKKHAKLLPHHRARSDCTPLATKTTLNNSHSQTSSSSLHCGHGLGWTGPGCGHNLQEWAPNFSRAPTLFETIPRFPVLWAPIPESVTNLRPGWLLVVSAHNCHGAHGPPQDPPPQPPSPSPLHLLRPHRHRRIRTHQHVMASAAHGDLVALPSAIHPTARKKHTRLPCHPLGSVRDDPVPEKQYGPIKTFSSVCSDKSLANGSPEGGTVSTVPSRSSMSI